MTQKRRRTLVGKKKSAGRGMFGGTRGWIAAGTLAAYAVMGGTKSALAKGAKGDPSGTGYGRGDAAAEEVRYCGGATGWGGEGL